MDGWRQKEQVRLTDGPELLVDVVRFRALAAVVAAHHPAAQPLCDACLTTLTEAAALYRADFLAGFTLADTAEFDTWQTLQTETLRLALADVLEKLATNLAGRKEWDPALGHARRWLALDPLHEPAHRLLMQLYARSGDRGAVAHQYRECVKVLQEELGAEPEPETTALFKASPGLPSRPLLPLSHSPTPCPQPPPRPDAVHRPAGRTEPARRTPGRSLMPDADRARPRRHRQDPAGDPGRAPRPGAVPPGGLLRGSRAADLGRADLDRDPA